MMRAKQKPKLVLYGAGRKQLTSLTAHRIGARSVRGILA
jgi:hypothetical protein